MSDRGIGIGAFRKMALTVSALCLFLVAGLTAWARAPLTIVVRDPAGNNVSGFRYLIEEDTTEHTVPGLPVTDSIGTVIHKSYAPVVAKGNSIFHTVSVPGLPDDMRFVVSVLPAADYSISGQLVDIGQNSVYVTVEPLPLETSQIFLFCFVDHNTINNVPDVGEPGLGHFSVVLADFAGPVSVDAFGNPLGTTYQYNPDGTPVLDVDGNPVPDQIGTGSVTTIGADEVNDPLLNPYGLQVGEALIKYLPQGKYGVIIIPEDATNWIQTATIEGTPTVDAWVRAGEPQFFTEGWGPGSWHCFFGFVNPDATGPVEPKLPWLATPPAGTGSLHGYLRYNHFGAPPSNQQFAVGEPVGEAWVGLNDPATGQGLYAAPCNPDTGEFSISGIPPGTYQLVWWDIPLDALFGFQSVVVPAGGGGTGEAVELGNVLAFRWFGNYEGSVFWDDGGPTHIPSHIGNGFRDPEELGIDNQAVLLRYRNGMIYQAQATDVAGNFQFSEVFPFFKWLIAEVDYTRYRPTGVTNVVDAGGALGPHAGWNYPSFDKLTPRPQVDPPNWPYGTAPSSVPVNNPNTGNNLSTTETGPVLTQALMLFLNQSNYSDYGKVLYGPGENGGISGIVYYATTRAENDPRWAAGENWEPGVPRVQVALYLDANIDAVIDDLNGSGAPDLADVDNYPFGWADGGAQGSEDVDRHPADPLFNPGDAVQIASSDSWDDNMPTGCGQTLPVIHGNPARECFDNYGTWNQIRPGVFDGGFAFGDYFPAGLANALPGDEPVPLPRGMYIVEAATPPGYTLLKEEDKNVDYGDSYIPPTQDLVPAICVGTADNLPASFEGLSIPYIVPPELALFPGIPAPYAGTARPLCNLKQVRLTDASNAPVNFFVLTEVPKAARAVGFVNNDLTAEFNAASPNFGEKSAPSWLPLSFQDWNGVEIARVYTDEWGAYNAMLPSTFTVNAPAPSGVAPHMVTVVLNHPLMQDPAFPGDPTKKILDPHWDPNFAQVSWTLHYYAGTVTYLDTPIVPIAAMVGYPYRNLDVEAPAGTPGIASVDGNAPSGGPVVCDTGGTITVTSKGLVSVPNPLYDPNLPAGPGNETTVQRDYGFGPYDPGFSLITLGGVPLAIVSWTNSTIEATVPAASTTGQLMVTRADTGRTSTTGLTLHVIDCANDCVLRVPSQYATIQAAIDAAADGCLILVAPGVYNENPIVYKPVTVQGSGTDNTILNAQPLSVDALPAWHAKVVSILGADPFAATEAPGFLVFGNAPGHPFSAGLSAHIDGFQVTGAITGGGIAVDTLAHYTEISNMKIRGNQGMFAGGISLGRNDQVTSNTNVSIRHCEIAKNGGVDGAGGIAIFTGQDGYAITDNLISGNLSRFNGGGILHEGLSGGGTIARNRITFNEVFSGLQIGGEGGGLWLGGPGVGGALGTGAGDVTVDSNLFQGNIAGAGKGGAIRVMGFNGADVEAAPTTPGSWYQLKIHNNIISNNVAAHSGAGIILQDAARVDLTNNTIAHNDSTATAITAFGAGQTVSTPRASGIVAAYHSLALRNIPGFTQTYSDPVLEDCILWQNRSWYYDPAANAGAGGLMANPAGLYQDLFVEDAPSPEALNPQYCVLSTTAGYAATNTSADPLFVTPYFNALAAAAVLDEGGTHISVRFDPIYPSAGDYHLSTTSSSAFNLGRSSSWTPGVGYSVPELAQDFDGQVRPRFFYPDAGADELHPAFLPLANLQVALTAFPDPVAVGQPLTLTVTVTNSGPNGADGVVAVTELPGGAGLIHATASKGTLRTGSVAGTRGPLAPGESVVAADVGSLAPGETAVVVLTITPSTPGPVPTTTTVDGAVQETDPADNTASAAPEAMPDADGDAAYDAIDCRPADPSVWSAPGAARFLALSGSASTDFTWSAPAAPGSVAVTYDLVRSTTASDFSAAACVASALSVPGATITESPASGEVFYYVVRTRNLCGLTPNVGQGCP